jgi:hypothetical protein
MLLVPAVMLMFINAKWVEPATLNAMMMYACFYGGFGQMVAGVFEVRVTCIAEAVRLCCCDSMGYDVSLTVELQQNLLMDGNPNSVSIEYPCTSPSMHALNAIIAPFNIVTIKHHHFGMALLLHMSTNNPC